MKPTTFMLISALAMLIAGCGSTPDMSNWATNSAHLASAVQAENDAILKRIDINLAELKRGEAEQWNLSGFDVTTWENNRNDYAEGADEVNAVMTAMVLYADALASLSAAGETGEEAVDSISSSITKATAIVGVSFPAAGAAIGIIRTLGDGWTRAQAQDSLAETMTSTQGAVIAMANHIEGIVDEQKDIVRSLTRLERELATQAANPNEMSWYRRNHQAIRASALANGADPIAAHAQLATILKLEERRTLRDRKRREAVRWRNAQYKALDAIVSAANAWKDSHIEAANFLAECGALRSLQPKCGNFTAANLRLAAGRIQSILDSQTRNEKE